MPDNQNSFSFDKPATAIPDIQDMPSRTSSSKVVAQLKASNEDFEWYPTTDSQIATVANDITTLTEIYELESRNVNPSILDIGAGDGRVLTALIDAANQPLGERDSPFKAFAIEKATTHTDTYRDKKIHLLGTEFHETNLITKNSTFAFANPPYSEFSAWISRIIEQLSFSVLYAVIPERWVDDGNIKQAMKNRGLDHAEVLAKSDFSQADRMARAKVHIVRFSFNDFSKEALAQTKDDMTTRDSWNRRYNWRPSIDMNKTSPFLLFIENELGIHKTHSETTEKFHEHVEKERVKRTLNDESSASYEIVQSRGVLWALIERYEEDMALVLEQYKLIGRLDGKLLAELGVKHEDLIEGVKSKLFGFRRVYWALLFEHLDTIKEKLTSEHKTDLLNTLSANGLDFTYKNAVYIIKFAVDMANELIEESLVDVFKGLTNADSVKTYYKSNERVFKDDWRYARYHGTEARPDRQCKRILDYRFIVSSWSNFGSNSWEYGLNENARQFTNDLFVVFRLLGYGNLHGMGSYDRLAAGDQYFIKGTHPDGDLIELIKIRFYKNGNRHLSFNAEAMLRFNIAVGKVLGWVRSKEDFTQETGTKTAPSDAIWSACDNMKMLPSTILALTSKAA